MLQFNAEHLYQILKDFYTITHIRIALFDSDLNELLSYPEKCFAFCDQIRRDPAVNAGCAASDRSGCRQCARTGKPALYHCHVGLTEAVVPILDKDSVIGYIFFGQILPAEGYEEAKTQLKQRFPAARFPGIGEAIDRIPAKTTEELSAAATVLQALTSYATTNRWVTPEKAAFIRQLDHYIEQHISESISVDTLCAEFHMGRTRLYSVAVDYLGCGPADYIRRQRIARAKELLCKTALPVTDIAYAVGFSDYNHFSRVFRRAVGISARTYRQQHQKAVAGI